MHRQSKGFYRFVPNRISLRIKLTFYICAVVLVCMGVMAAICITISLNITKKLMSERLAYFASIKAEQTERGLKNEAVVLDTVLQGDRITNTLQSVYFGNITSLQWASNMNSIVSDMYTTNLRPVQLITFYDVRGNILFSSRNPDFSNDSVRQMKGGIATLFPLGHTINVTTSNSSVNHNATTNSSLTYFLNQTFEAANSSQLEAFAAQAAIDASEAQNSTNIGQSTYKPPIQFSKIGNGLLSWMAPPVPIYNSTGGIGAYSFSITTPMNHLQVRNSVQASTLIGYCTAVMDASRYMNGSYTLETTSYPTDTSDFALSVIGVDNDFWRFIFPTDPDELTKLHPLYTFPAVQASRDLWRKRHLVNDTSKNPAGAMMDTHAPNINRASVGYSFINAMGNEWMIAVSVPRARVEHSYWVQIHKLIGVALAILAFCALAALLSTNFIVNPLLYINRGMELKPREFRQKQQNNKTTLLVSHPKVNDSRLSFEEWPSDEENPSDISISSDTTKVEKPKVTDNGKAKKKGNEEKNEAKDSRESLQNTIDGDSNSVATAVSHFSSETSSNAYYINTVENECDDEDVAEVFRIPEKIEPLHRWFVDEVDELIEVYNCLVDRLVRQHTKVEDEVRLRTREARESQRLAETANQAKSRFMMNISHELLTPMNGIMGITAVSLEEGRLPQMYAGLRTILKSGNILQELLNELLTYAAHLAGVEHSFQQFSLQRLRNSIEDTFKTRANTKGVDFRVAVSPESLEDCQVESDFERIMHICTSLVSNAVKFSDPEKRKEYHFQQLRSPKPNEMDAPCSPRVWVNILLRKPDKYVDIPAGDTPPEKYSMLEIIVSDNGIGITKNKLAHIFEVFEQGEDALSKHFTGTGLGLAMSKLLCEALGGSISVSSSAYVGSIVELRVPVYKISAHKVENRPPFTLAFNSIGSNRVVWRTNTKRTQLVQINTGGHSRRNSRLRITVSHKSHHSDSSLSSSTPTPKPKTESVKRESLENLSILVVDDNPMLRDLYTKMLKNIGIGTIHVACNGEEAIQAVEKAIVNGTRYRIIFMDLEMPKKSGVETTQFIWRQLGYSSPVVALTGHSDEKTLRECKEMGLRVLVKPVQLDQLRETVEKLNMEMSDGPQCEVTKPNI